MSQFIQLKTAIPGPLAQTILDRRYAAVGRAISHSIPTVLASGEGALVTDVDGNVFIDFAGAIGTLNVGHALPELVHAVQQQVQSLVHTCFAVALYEPYIQLAEQLNRITPGQFAKKTLFFNSGAEAVENAIKIARKFTKRRGVVSFERAFHGRTYMALSLTRKNKPYKNGLGPFMPDTYHWPYPDYYHAHGMTPEQLDAYLLNEIERSLLTEVDPKDLACVVMEPQQGEGGFIVPSKGFVQGIRKICDQHGIVLIVDEIQSGFARTGKMFAIEHFDIEADLMTMSKSIAGGMPLSAITGRSEMMDAPDLGELGGTYGGSPVSCAAGLAVIQAIESMDLVTRSRVLGGRVRERLLAIQQKVDYLGDVRGLGSMIAMEFVKDIQTREPDASRTQRIAKLATQHGLMLLTAGLYGNVIRLLYPLVITDEQLEEGLAVLEKAILEA